MVSEDISKDLFEIADNLRGSLEYREMMNYVYALIFYKYLSSIFENHINLVKDETLTLLEAYEDKNNYNMIKESALSELGYFIEFDDLFENILFAENTVNLHKLSHALKQISLSDNKAFSHIFDDVNFFSPKLDMINDNESLFTRLMVNINSFGLIGKYSLTNLFESLLYKQSEDMGKKAGEFVTTDEINILLAAILSFDKPSVDSIYDPFLGCGMSLVNIYNFSDVSKVYGQEINLNTYNLARMNLIIHGIDFNDLDIVFGDTLANPGHLGEKFDLIVSEPPFNMRHGLEISSMEGSERFYGFNVPKSRVDYLNILHMIYHLKDDGRIAVIVPKGVLFRKPDRDIRKFLIEDNNYLDAVINLPANLLVQTAIPVSILIFEKNRNSKEVLFIDASKEFKSQRRRNLLTEENISKICKTYRHRKVIDKFSSLVTINEIKRNDFNLTISRYIDTFEGELIKLNDVLNEREKLNKEYHMINNEIELLINKLNINIR